MNTLGLRVPGGGGPGEIRYISDQALFFNGTDGELDFDAIDGQLEFDLEDKNLDFDAIPVQDIDDVPPTDEFGGSCQ